MLKCRNYACHYIRHHAIQKIRPDNKCDRNQSEQADDLIDTLQFDFLIYKYGYPNDEVSHPLSKYGLGSYGLFQVTNSPWVTELRDNNRQHYRHTDSSFDDYKHYVAKFKDVTVEIICTNMQEIQLTKSELLVFLDEQISYLVK